MTEFLSGNGALSTTDSQGVKLGSYQDETGHNIADVFWTWMNDPASGFRPDVGLDWLGFVVSFKGVVLEGLEVIFIVITFGLNAH